jgi:hypothetical protein
VPAAWAHSQSSSLCGSGIGGIGGCGGGGGGFGGGGGGGGGVGSGRSGGLPNWSGGKVTVVVSPLVSLMEDQVGGLQSAGVPSVMLGGANASNQVIFSSCRWSNRHHSTMSVKTRAIIPP